MAIPRRTILSGTAACVAGAFLPASAASAAEPVTVSAEGITLVGGTDGSVAVRDGAGVERIRLSHFMFKDSVLGTQRTFGGTPSLVTLPDGRAAIQVDYVVGSSAEGVAVRGLFDVTPHKAHLRYEVSGSATLTPTGFMFARAVVDPSAPEAYVPLTTWTRDARGGVPYEVRAGGVYQETWSDTRAFFRLAATTPAWSNGTWLHAPGTATGTGAAVTEAELVLGALRPSAAATVADNRALGVEVWTDQPFNLWDGPGQTMTLRTQVVNGGASVRTVRIGFSARDFDGRPLAGQEVDATIAAGAAWDGAFTVASPAQGIVFTEVTAVAGTDEALARTNLAALPPYSYRAGKESMFGIANYPWLLEPSKADVAALLQRLGVKWVRIAYDGAPGIPTDELDALGIAHNVQKGGIPIGGTAEQIRAWADDMVQTLVSSGAAYYEAGNELNQPWMSGQGAAEYVRDGLRPLRDALAQAGPAAAHVKVMNAGTGGMDYNWLGNLHAAGGWDLIDVLAIHPGRGNFTPDYAPPPEDWEQGANGTYWNFLGSVRKARSLVEEYGGGKEIWLTEAYACTRPNNWWNDTYRQAAENVLLTLALAKAEGVRGVNWYQLHDSTIHHPQEADPANPEYHFGLMNRDTSAKPSLLAYATAARVLDQATFVRWLTFADADLKGLLFRTPTGPVSILWSRKDGYLLNIDHVEDDPWYAAPEPWVDHWPTKTAISLPVVGTKVRELNCIGQQRTLSAQRGRVTVHLDGAPRIYYGLPENLDARARA